MQRQKRVIGIMAAVAVALGLLVTGVQAQSGNLEPPPSAVDGGGDPDPTTQTQPSWDQTLPVVERFVLVMGGAAVLDRETGLVWEQSPDNTFRIWEDRLTVLVDARLHCVQRETGGRMGWRLPSISELTNLLVPGDPAGGPDLPAGHPFSGVLSTGYWSATPDADTSTDAAWLASFANGMVVPSGKSLLNAVWCVRGAWNAEAY